MGRVFNRLQTKLTVLYAGLFALAAEPCRGSRSILAIAANAQQHGATSELSDQRPRCSTSVWALRTQRLRDGADLIWRATSVSGRPWPPMMFRPSESAHGTNLQSAYGPGHWPSSSGSMAMTIGIDAAWIDGGAELDL